MIVTVAYPVTYYINDKMFIDSDNMPLSEDRKRDLLLDIAKYAMDHYHIDPVIFCTDDDHYDDSSN